MSHSLRPKAKARREARSDASAAASGARCTEDIFVKSNKTGEDVHTFFLTHGHNLTLFTLA